MVRIAICDDEPFYCDKIKNLLEAYMKRNALPCEIRTFVSGDALLGESGSDMAYDIVFLDINMEEMDGLQTAERLRAYHSDTHIVFVTAFIDYALEGYKVNAIRYLMKDQLEGALEECMWAILRKMQISKVTFSFMEGEQTLYADQISYVESRGHKSFFHYMDVVYQIYAKLDEIEEQLSGRFFLRIHKSYLVNMRHICSISNYMVLLDTDEELPVPRRRYREVKEAFVDYKGAL